MRNNEYNKAIKLLKKHFSERFQKTIELTQSKILSNDDICFFCENEPTVSYIIEELKKKKSDEITKQANKAIIKRDSSLIDISLKNVENEKAILSDEFARLMISEPISPEEVLQKQIDLNNLLDRIKSCDIIYNDLQNCKDKNFKITRGRPHKKENKELIELATEYINDEKNILKLDEEINNLICQLSQEEKQYIKTYIKNMIETKKNLFKD